jgi:S1/P1 Nuclease
MTAEPRVLPTLEAIHMQRWLIALIFVISTPNLALAWGELGHRTVAEIATRYLVEQTAAEVHKLLGDGAHVMTEVSVWADTIVGDRPGTYPWHVVQIPRDGSGYDRNRDCPNNDCIVEKITELARVLGDRTIDTPLRIEALQFLIHFVGDLHMPLHAFVGLNRYRSGAWVRIGETTDKLHLWWDNVFVDALGSDSGELANRLTVQITVDDRKKWEMGTSEDWANESFRITHEFVTKYGLLDNRWDTVSEDRPIVLPTSVLDEVKPIVAQRLKMAGVRLAWVLNQSLK